MRRGFLMLSVFLALVLVGSADHPVGQAAMPKPDAPYALASGDSVRLAFTLPREPRPQRVHVLRAAKDGPAFTVVADLDAAALAWTDKDVRAGQTYLYVIRTLRGAATSEPSDPAEVTVGGTARLTLVGGSLERALFEVTIYRGGKRHTARFVHKPGEAIGDLAWVPELNSAADFRLGPTLVGLSLGESDAIETSRLALKNAAGEPITDLGGQPIELDFAIPTGSHEVLRAAIRTKGGNEVTLQEGATLQVE
jgi:hypothetical protein